MGLLNPARKPAEKHAPAPHQGPIQESNSTATITIHSSSAKHLPNKVCSVVDIESRPGSIFFT
jgi:hypothetical protein